jgi:hypothetical protein
MMSLFHYLHETIDWLLKILRFHRHLLKLSMLLQKVIVMLKIYILQHLRRHLQILRRHRHLQQLKHLQKLIQSR